MDWIHVSPQIHSTFGSLGYSEGDTYFINDNCLLILQDILTKLTGEDRILRTFRRAVGFGQNVKKDLVPILIHVKDNPKVIEITIKILVNLTIPVECLLSIDDLTRNNVGRHTIYELNNLLLSSKEAFTDTRVTKAVLKYIQEICVKEYKMPIEQVERVNNGLLLLRNILHVPVYLNGVGNPSTHGSSQNRILWNLFTQSIDKILLNLITCTNGANWSVTMVQLIALIYKDQHVGTLQKLLNIWFESSFTDSSDNESNTSPPEQGSDDSSAMVSSDPTSESSDSGANRENKRVENRTTGGTKDSHFHQMDDYQNSHINNKKHTPGGSTFATKHQAHSPHSSQTSHTSNTSHSSHTSHSPQNKEQTHKSSESDGPKGSTDKNPPSSLSVPAPASAPLSPPAPGPFIPPGPLNPAGCKRGPTTPLSQLMQTTGPKRDCMSAISEFSDYGYVTQMENPESISTSSNEDDAPQQKPVHQKPVGSKQRHSSKARSHASVSEKKDNRRKKLVKRGKTNIINMKGLVHHTATDEDITNLLKEFTVDFLLKGYGSLVHSLYTQLLYDLHLQIDTSHFFWLVTYFLKFAAQLELDYEHVHLILSFEIVSYLTYEGVHLCEQIQLLSRTQSSELKPSLRRMHLVVTSIREFIQTVDAYGKIAHLSEDDRAHLKKLQARICSTEELRCLLVLLIRHFQPEIHSKQYLQDLIVTNHVLLLFLDNGAKQPEAAPSNMLEHIRQFATVEVMHQYGLLLEEFRSNGEFVNDCIFTMMHHVGGDLNTITALFQPNILKIFSLIWETDFEICDDWSDLVDYVINQFIKAPRPIVPTPLFKTENLRLIDRDHDAVPSPNSWTQEEQDKLKWYYMQSTKNNDIIASVAALFKEDGVEKSDESILDQLYEQEVISRDEYLKLQNNGEGMETSLFSCTASVFAPSDKDDVEKLKGDLIRQNMKKALVWLQKELLEVCYAKHCLSGKTREENVRIHDHIKDLIEPIAFHSLLVNQSIPIVPWNNDQSTAIHNQTFLHLLHRLGFHLPEDSGKLFVRIPNFWTTDVLLHIAHRLGPIDQAGLKFQMEDVRNGGSCESKNSMDHSSDLSNEADDIPKFSIMDSTFAPDSSFRIRRTKQIHSLVQFTPLPSSSLPMNDLKTGSSDGPSTWLNLIMKTKPSCREQKKKSTQKRPNTSSSGLSLALSSSCCEERQSVKRRRNNKSSRNNNFKVDTTSIDSNLTRMYVSDEDLPTLVDSLCVM